MPHLHENRVNFTRNFFHSEVSPVDFLKKTMSKYAMTSPRTVPGGLRGRDVSWTVERLPRCCRDLTRLWELRGAPLAVIYRWPICCNSWGISWLLLDTLLVHIIYILHGWSLPIQIVMNALLHSYHRPWIIGYRRRSSLWFATTKISVPAVRHRFYYPSVIVFMRTVFRFPCPISTTSPCINPTF